MVFECQIRLRLPLATHWRNVKVKISPRFHGILVEIFHNEHTKGLDSRNASVPSVLQSVVRPSDLRTRNFSPHLYATQKPAYAIKPKPRQILFKSILMAGLQSICAAQSRSENEFRILNGDETILLQALDKVERNRILDYMTAAEI
jgi:hypothetical protein